MPKGRTKKKAGRRHQDRQGDQAAEGERKRSQPRLRGAALFYTPRSVVRVLVEMLEPYKGRVYDPCCGSGGMLNAQRDST